MADSPGAGHFDPRYDPAFQPGYTAAEGGSGGESAVANRVPQPREGEAVIADPENEAVPADLENETVRDPNPFERTLWVVALVLVVGGVAASLWANSFNYVSSMNAWGWPQMIQAAAWAVTTPMVTVGLATGVGLLFRRAIAWTPDP